MEIKCKHGHVGIVVVRGVRFYCDKCNAAISYDLNGLNMIFDPLTCGNCGRKFMLNYEAPVLNLFATPIGEETHENSTTK